jgi:hypothetical protein
MSDRSVSLRQRCGWRLERSPCSAGGGAVHVELSRARLPWIDREIPNILYIETEDRGKSPTTLWIGYVYNPANGDASTNDWADFADDINKHRTTWIFEWESLPGLSPDDFDTALLTKKTQ